MKKDLVLGNDSNKLAGQNGCKVGNLGDKKTVAVSSWRPSSFLLETEARLDYIHPENHPGRKRASTEISSSFSSQSVRISWQDLNQYITV